MDLTSIFNNLIKSKVDKIQDELDFLHIYIYEAIYQHESLKKIEDILITYNYNDYKCSNIIREGELYYKCLFCNDNIDKTKQILCAMCFKSHQDFNGHKIKEQICVEDTFCSCGTRGYLDSFQRFKNTSSINFNEDDFKKSDQIENIYGLNSDSMSTENTNSNVDSIWRKNNNIICITHKGLDNNNINEIINSLPHEFLVDLNKIFREVFYTFDRK